MNSEITTIKINSFPCPKLRNNGYNAFGYQWIDKNDAIAIDLASVKEDDYYWLDFGYIIPGYDDTCRLAYIQVSSFGYHISLRL